VPTDLKLTVLDREQLRSVTLEDEDLMRELLAALIDDTSRQIHLLDRAIREHDAGETIRLAHYSKGACANVGARSAAAILQQLERIAAQGDFGRCGSALGALASEIDKLRAEASRV
jgi:HPt (histidine-containing phosphotransfer) domain-containing protein